LAELPDTLDETYERTLREIKKADWELAHRLFQCVAVASRPLRVEELAEFLAFDFKVEPIPKFREDWRLEDPVEAVLSACSTLLSIVNVSEFQVVQFSHFSVKELLTSTRFAEKHDTTSHHFHISMTTAHSLVAQACLGILLHLGENITRKGLEKYPLIEYAAEHWFEHARFGGVSQNAEEGMKQLFDASKSHFATWLWIYNPIRPNERTERPSRPYGTPLHYAAFCGLHAVVNFLAIKYPKDVHSRSMFDHATPLHLASQQGSVQVARVLVLHGARMTVRDKSHLTSLHRASIHGHKNVAQFLIKKGADLAAKDQYKSTPLHCASERGHVGLARILVEHGANVSVKDKYRSTPLHRALDVGHVGLVRFLVEHGADVSAMNKNDVTPLHWSSMHCHLGLTRFLVEHGADVSARDKDHITPLHWAAMHGHMGLARFLVEHGSDVTAKSKDGSTPLHRASKQGHVELAQFLLEHSADISAKDKDLSTPLLLASEGGYIDLVQFLVQYGADASTKNKRGFTPLHRASIHGLVDVAQYLVEHGAHVSAKTKYGMTPLHYTSMYGHV
jgi:ankyrin repeat protein